MHQFKNKFLFILYVNFHLQFSYQFYIYFILKDLFFKFHRFTKMWQKEGSETKKYVNTTNSWIELLFSHCPQLKNSQCYMFVSLQNHTATPGKISLTTAMQILLVPPTVAESPFQAFNWWRGHYSCFKQY